LRHAFAEPVAKAAQKILDADKSARLELYRWVENPIKRCCHQSNKFFSLVALMKKRWYRF